MISLGMVRRGFRRMCNGLVIYRHAVKEDGELASIPLVVYKNELIEHCVIKGVRVEHRDTEIGLIQEDGQRVTWNPDELSGSIVPAAGDRMNIGGTTSPNGEITGGVDYRIVSHKTSMPRPGLIFQIFDLVEIREEFQRHG